MISSSRNGIGVIRSPLRFESAPPVDARAERGDWVGNGKFGEVLPRISLGAGERLLWRAVLFPHDMLG